MDGGGRTKFGTRVERAGVRGSFVSKVLDLHDPLILSFFRREKEADFFRNLLGKL
jgi:hypothetical protein